MYVENANRSTIVGGWVMNWDSGNTGTKDAINVVNGDFLHILGVHCYTGYTARRALTLDSGSSKCVILGNALGNGVSDSGSNNIIRYNYGWKTEASGTATFSGDGSTTTFTIAHGLSAAPTSFYVTPTSADAAGSFYLTADATNITITYSIAPPSGTNNLTYNWRGEV